MRLSWALSLSMAVTACMPKAGSKLNGDQSSDDANVAQGTDTTESTGTGTDLTVSQNPIEVGLAQFNQESMREELTHIASDQFQGRLSATPENAQVGDWLIEKLRALNIPPAGEDYRQKFLMSVGPTTGQETANIIAKIEGQDPVLKDQYVIIGAHMDHTGTLNRGYTCSRGPVDDAICNGADDNASGTISVLNIAKALAAVRGNLKRSVLIAWFSGEEEGLLGSKHFVKSPLVPLSRIVYMINLDMVGYAKTNNNQIGVLGVTSSDQGMAIVREVVQKYKPQYSFLSSQPGGGSDHAPFFNVGIPGVFFHTGVKNNPNYHRTGDHANLVDFNGMSVAAKVAFESAFTFANSRQRLSLTELQDRQPLISNEEADKSCHDLIQMSENLGPQDSL